ncbi:hypothetical protein N7470_009620 [Penicillium chermesinum]|nr:hypothetical protein N7470_009620 [Penicillium chermesinum]
MFPNPAICAVILSSSKLFSSPLQIDQGPGNSQPVNYPGKDPIIPSNSHPLEFARRLVQLALCLKQFDAPSAQQFQKHLGEPVPIVAQRFSNVANHYVLSQDYLIASLEGIETLILQTRWYATVGNFRIACEIHRRATRIALSINILKLIETDYRAEKIWFHLVYSDRFLSLMLGIPSASTNDAFAHPSRLAINSPDEKMERIHTLLAGQLISRNLRIQEATSEQQKGSLILHEYKETKRIDDQLKKAARIMPTNWWRVQSLTNAASDREVLQRTSKLLLQMHQYFLLVALHQPYIVPLASTGYDSIDHTYSQLAATAACREMLLRFIIVRDYHRSPSYQALEGKAFTAAITLLFVHFNGHKLGHANFLAHQRPQDLDLVEQTVDLLDSLATSKRNLNCASQSQTLKQFMKIDQEAADGSLFITWNEQQITGKTKEDMNPQNCLRLPIPYFGIVSISPFESPRMCHGAKLHG